MPSVDSRVVRMEFDNASFERGVATTIQTIGKLQESLKFKGATTGLSDIQTAAGKVHFNSITQGIEGVSKGFIALATIAITTLSRITGAALTAGANFVKSFTFGPIQQGFQEFELNMNSIQTILANTSAKGTGLADVNAALDQLNQYSDKTIYNFGQMARNIGTFTAAGVDLNTSVQSIKGIANLAAISGSSSEQASTAMYQLSQAISTGTLRLMDWNSVVNAGMGGEVFQKALFESGKALGTIKDIPIGTTFEQWTDAGNSFRGSLESGWLTAEVLTTTLQGFTGEMTEADLLAKGFTKEQAAGIMELGRIGVDAATKVRTLSQLLSTVKESVGSGWSASFRLLVGNFEESTKLFTTMSDAIGAFVSKNADARNAILQTWVNLGGRMVVIEAFRKLLINLGMILKPIQEAFRTLFPPITGERLAELSWAFLHFVEALKPSPTTIAVVKSAFLIFFSVLKIGWEIVKQGVKFIGSLLTLLSSGDTSRIASFFTNLGSGFADLAQKLTTGGGIAKFFQGIMDALKGLPDLLGAFKDKITGLFDGVDPKVPDALGESMGRFSDRFQSIKDAFGGLGRIWEPFSNAMQKVFDILDKVWIAVRDWFKQLGQKIADNMGEGDFNAVLDAINVGLLTAIAALLARFFKKGFKFDLTGGAFDKLKSMFEELTGVFGAMQTKLKSEALLKIAIAIGILTASVLTLSLIDSAALTKALTAMSVGFAQLMAAFGILSKITLGPSSAASFTILAAGMIVLSTAILILAGAAKAFGSMSWGELARGLTGVTVALLALSLAAIPLSANSAGLMRAGLSMIPLSLALVMLSKSVQAFANMNWDELVRGILGMTAAVLGIGLAMRTFPSNMAITGIGLALVALSLGQISQAVGAFGAIDVGTLAKGIISMGLALAAIGLAMQLMPTNMPLTAAGLLLVSLALVGIQKAVSGFGGMDWGKMAKGLVGMGGALLVLGVGLTLMSGTVGGAVALGIAAVSMGLLLKVMEGFAKVKIPDLVRGLIAMGASLAVLAGAALLLGPAIPFMAGLGAALVLVGAGFALFGVGAAATAKAFELFAKVGPKGAKAFTEAMKTVAKAIPMFIAAMAEGLVEAMVVLGKMAGPLAESLGLIIAAVMDQLIKLAPKLGQLLAVLIQQLIDLLRAKVPEYVLLGVDIIMAVLTGIRNRIGEIVTVVGEIITKFLEAMTTQVPLIVTAVADLWIAMITSVAEAVGRVGATLMFGVAIALITGFLDGAKDQLGKVWQWVVDFVTGIIDRVKSAFGINSPSTVFHSIGVDLITGFLNGIVEAAVAVFNWFKNLAKTVLSNVGDMLSTLKDKGYQLISGFFTGITDRWTGIVNWFGGMGSKILDAIGNIGNSLYNIGKDIIQGLWNGMQNVWDRAKGWLGGLGSAIISLKGPPRDDKVLLVQNGMFIMQGLQVGMEKEWGKTTKWLSSLNPADHIDADSVHMGFQKILDAAALSVSEMETAQPVITPVLDLTQVQAGAAQMQGIFANALVPVNSIGLARQISLDTTRTTPDEPKTVQTGDVTYVQNVNAPKQLSTADIYRQTRNLIVVRKEELAIP